MPLTALPLAGTFGAQIAGIDLRSPLSAADSAWLQGAWSAYRLLLFRDQNVDDSAHAAFSAHFGTPVRFQPSPAGTETFVYGASNTDEHGQVLPEGHALAQPLRINWAWHIDGSYRAMPNKAVVLRALVVPPQGGDTEFADLQHACATLPTTMAQRIRHRRCTHSFAHMIERCGMPAVTPEEAASLPSARQPLVWRHADGRRTLFLSPPYMSHIEGLSYEAGQALVDELVAWCGSERFVHRHHWRPGDVLTWDNRFTMHRVTPYDLARHARVMRGATLMGTDLVEADV